MSGPHSWVHGLVIGKFLPPHKGHGLLIETALEQVEQLTVLVCADTADPIPAPLRAAWLRERYPEAAVRVVPSTGMDPDDSVLWARATISWLGRAPDVVFTSEPYGQPFSCALGCAHVSVDPPRRRVPIAARQIRAQPLAHVEFLEPAVRAYFIPRIVLVGTESTGKTTLAQGLAAYYRTAWVPEYGRAFSEGLLRSHESAWTTRDFVHIALMQQRLEDELARHAHRVLICDTDAFATSLWHELYMGHQAPAVQRLAKRRRYALYLLAGDEIPWMDDGTRDRKEERGGFQARFLEELRSQGKPFVVVSGAVDARLSTAVAAIDELLAGASSGFTTAVVR